MKMILMYTHEQKFTNVYVFNVSKFKYLIIPSCRHGRGQKYSPDSVLLLRHLQLSSRALREKTNKFLKSNKHVTHFSVWL